MSDEACARYVRFLETLTPAALHNLGAFVTDDVVFRDPFNDVRGCTAMQRVLQKMFDDLSEIDFCVTAQASQRPISFIAWELTGRLSRSGQPLRLNGVSHLVFADDGRVKVHIDYWDAASQLYERLPLLGPVLRMLRRRMAVGG